MSNKIKCQKCEYYFFGEHKNFPNYSTRSYCVHNENYPLVLTRDEVRGKSNKDCKGYKKVSKTVLRNFVGIHYKDDIPNYKYAQMAMMGIKDLAKENNALGTVVRECMPSEETMRMIAKDM